MLRVKGFEVTTGVIVAVMETEEDKLDKADLDIPADEEGVKGLEEAIGEVVNTGQGV